MYFPINWKALDIGFLKKKKDNYVKKLNFWLHRGKKKIFIEVAEIYLPVIKRNYATTFDSKCLWNTFTYSNLSKLVTMHPGRDMNSKCLRLIANTDSIEITSETRRMFVQNILHPLALECGTNRFCSKCAVRLT